jgi:hypothetical protein
MVKAFETTRVLVVALLTLTTISSQVVRAQSTLTNQDIVTMVSGGLSEQVIVTAIQQSTTRDFDLSPNGLLDLKKRGVSDSLISEMQRAATPPSRPAPTQASPASTSLTKDAAAVIPSTQGKRVIVVDAFTLAAGVELPYDTKQLQAGLVADLKVQMGKDFEIVSEVPSARQVYRLTGEVTGWRPGNAAKRIVIGLGSGREATDLHFRVTDGSGQAVVDSKDTIRTNFYSQTAGSVGTLVHPIAQKIAERIKDAKLK